MLLSLLCIFVFFQAEDGIRDLVRSRGLGDVYKRQPRCVGRAAGAGVRQSPQAVFDRRRAAAVEGCVCAVSYTHLTLPTSDLV